MLGSLWIAQGLLAAAFVMAGGMKLSAPIDQLQAQMPWVSGAMGALGLLTVMLLASLDTSMI